MVAKKSYEAQKTIYVVPTLDWVKPLPVVLASWVTFTTLDWAKLLPVASAFGAVFITEVKLQPCCLLPGFIKPQLQNLRSLSILEGFRLSSFDFRLSSFDMSSYLISDWPL